MIIKLLGADFSKSNIGTVGNYNITYLGNIMGGSPASIEKNELGTQAGRKLEASIAIKSDYEYAGITIHVGDAVLPEENYTLELSDTVLTITILPEMITGDIVMDVETNYIGTGDEEDEYIEYTNWDGFERHQGFINQSGGWNNFNEKYYHIVVPVNGDTSLTFTANPDGPVFYYAGLTSYSIPTGTDSPVNFSEVSPWNKRMSASAGTTKTYATIPSDIKYLFFTMVYNGNDATPSNILIRTKKQ